MGVQDKIEHVLREIHVMFANSRYLKSDENMILVEKQKVFQLLNQLNVYIYEMMDEREIMEADKDRIAREARREGSQIIADSEKQAESIYAASVMYTDEALENIQKIIEQANEQVENVLRQAKDSLMAHQETLQENQLELSGQLQDMADSKLYLRIIEERKRKIARKFEKDKKGKKQAGTEEKKGIIKEKPVIKVNEGYFARTGRSLNEVYGEEEEETVKEIPEITVNLDAEYFKWKSRKEEGLEEDDEDSEEEAEG